VRKRVASGLLFAALMSNLLAQTVQSKIPISPKDGVEGLVVNSTISATGMVFF
jgi:hypothetical protein